MMARFLRQSELAADASDLASILADLPKEDFLGRIGLESRLYEVSNELTAEEGSQNNLASTAIYFGGKPVIGSLGIEAEFAATAIADFKDLVVKVWATSDAEIATRGPVPNQDAAKLHVTALLHGSMGFLVEEIDLRASPLFPTPLKRASEDAVKLMVSMATESDEGFETELERIPPRVFASVQRFFNDLHRSEATLRLVDEVGETSLNREAVDKAFVRLESSVLEEIPLQEIGLLLGIIPNAGRFEFKSEHGVYREGRVAPTLSEAFLKRIEEEQGIGKWFLAKFIKKEVRRFGRVSTAYTLVELIEHEAPTASIA